jgi:hypothetical protein
MSRIPAALTETHRLTQNEQTKQLVMQNSGVAWKDRAHFEDDHFAPLCLGGSDSVNNRWAQPRFGTWNAAVKDHLEATACEMVCNGEVELPSRRTGSTRGLPTIGACRTAQCSKTIQIA